MAATETKYIEGLGRRKTSVARVRITPATKTSIEVNNKSVDEYFTVSELQEGIMGPISTAALPQKFVISVQVKGGGISSQADAIRHGLSRALVKYDETLRKSLKSEGMLKRDPRAKERKKFGLRKARRAPQWSKR
jgi:small subunit ribosomal protein S9